MFHRGRIDYRTEGEVVKNLIFALLLVSIGGTTLAKDTSVGNETVLAIRNVEVAGFKVTLRDTKRLETGEEVYCTQYIAGIYTDPDTLGTVAQIGSVCQVGSLPKQPENAIAALLLSAESAK